MEYNSEYVLITGGSMGIGYELAKIFAENKYNLILVARSGEDLLKVKREIQNLHKVEVVTIKKDLFDVNNAFDLYEDVAGMGIHISILVNNAGQGEYGEFSETSIGRELSIIQLNISSLVVLTKLFLLDMLRVGEGKILNLSSVASKAPGPWQSVYHGTKAFVQSFTEAVREEVKDKNITITALLPGATDTDFFRKADMLDAKPVVEGKLDDPAKVARDGFNALMEGDDMVVSGFKNKVQVGLGGLMSDSAKASMVNKQQSPASEKKQ